MSDIFIKRLLIFFGVLDFFILLRAYDFFYILLFSNTPTPWIYSFYIVIYASLVLSGYFLVKQPKTGLWINFFQFPFRLAFAFYSFGFLMMPAVFFGGPELILRIMSPFMVILEVCRFVLSIIIYVTYFRKNRSPQI